jgi:hypothetical protein
MQNMTIVFNDFLPRWNHRAPAAKLISGSYF